MLGPTHDAPPTHSLDASADLVRAGNEQGWLKAELSPVRPPRSSLFSLPLFPLSSTVVCFWMSSMSQGRSGPRSCFKCEFPRNRAFSHVNLFLPHLSGTPAYLRHPRCLGSIQGGSLVNTRPQDDTKTAPPSSHINNTTDPITRLHCHLHSTSYLGHGGLLGGYPHRRATDLSLGFTPPSRRNRIAPHQRRRRRPQRRCPIHLRLGPRPPQAMAQLIRPQRPLDCGRRGPRPHGAVPCQRTTWPFLKANLLCL